MRLFRKQFGLRALIACVSLCALLLWAVRVSYESRPPRLYAGWLDDDDLSRRLQAAQELGGLGTEPDVVIPALMTALLHDASASVRKRSAVSLAAVVSKLNDGPTTAAVAGAFVQALRDQDPGVRTAAAEGLGRIGPEPEAVVPALLRCSDDSSEWVRGAAVGALALVERKAGVDRADVRSTIAAALCDRSLHVRELSIYASWMIGERSAEFSAALLRHKDVRVRRAAVIALARSSPVASRVVTELTAALTDEDAAVREGAARALKNLGPLTVIRSSPSPR